MKGCVFEKKKENKIRTRRELRITFHKVKKVVFVTAVTAVLSTSRQKKVLFYFLPMKRV